MDAFGYFFGKFILLIVLFFNVVYQHDTAKSLIIQQQQQQQRRNAMGNSIISTRTPIAFSSSPYGSQIGVNTALTITDATQFSGEVCINWNFSSFKDVFFIKFIKKKREWKS